MSNHAGRTSPAPGSIERTGAAVRPTPHALVERDGGRRRRTDIRPEAARRRDLRIVVKDRQRPKPGEVDPTRNRPDVEPSASRTDLVIRPDVSKRDNRNGDDLADLHHRIRARSGRAGSFVPVGGGRKPARGGEGAGEGLDRTATRAPDDRGDRSPARDKFGRRPLRAETSNGLRDRLPRHRAEDAMENKRGKGGRSPPRVSTSTAVSRRAARCSDTRATRRP